MYGKRVSRTSYDEDSKPLRSLIGIQEMSNLRNSDEIFNLRQFILLPSNYDHNMQYNIGGKYP